MKIETVKKASLSVKKPVEAPKTGLDRVEAALLGASQLGGDIGGTTPTVGGPRRSSSEAAICGGFSLTVFRQVCGISFDGAISCRREHGCKPACLTGPVFGLGIFGSVGSAIATHRSIQGVGYRGLGASGGAQDGRRSGGHEDASQGRFSVAPSGALGVSCDEGCPNIRGGSVFW